MPRIAAKQATPVCVVFDVARVPALIAFTLQCRMPECRGPRIDWSAVLLLRSIAMDHAVAGYRSEPWHRLRILTDSLKQRRSIEVAVLWLSIGGVVKKVIRSLIAFAMSAVAIAASRAALLRISASVNSSRSRLRTGSSMRYSRVVSGSPVTNEATVSSWLRAIPNGWFEALSLQF